MKESSSSSPAVHGGQPDPSVVTPMVVKTIDYRSVEIGIKIEGAKLLFGVQCHDGNLYLAYLSEKENAFVLYSVQTANIACFSIADFVFQARDKTDIDKEAQSCS